MPDLKSLDNTAVVLGELQCRISSCLACRDPNTRVLLNDLSLREQCCQLCFQIGRNSNTPCLCCKYHSSQSMQPYHSWCLRPRSYDKTGLRPASVLLLVLYFWSWSWSCSFGLELDLNILVLLPTLTARCSAKRWTNEVS